MKITSVETITIRHSWGPPEEGVTRDWPLILIRTDEGVTGIGRGGDIETIQSELAPLLVGKDPRRITLLWHRMYEEVWKFRGPGNLAMSSVGALDVALWDIVGKATGQPIWRLLGGFRDRVPVYADGIGYTPQTPETVASLVKKHADMGFGAVKFHLDSGDTDEALEKVRLSREAIGDDVKLMIDAHRAWNGTVAAEMARKFKPYNLYWIEEPVRGDDEPSYLRMVREATTSMIAGGESDGTLGGARRLIAEGGLQLLQTDIMIGGGFTGGKRFAALAEAFHVPIAPHGAQYPDINSHMVAAVPNGLIVPACPDTEPYEIWSKLYNPRLQIDHGEIALTEKPGLGLELDWDFVEKYRVQ